MILYYQLHILGLETKFIVSNKDKSEPKPKPKPEIYVPYSHHYKPCHVYNPFFSVVYNQERLILQTIYVLNKEIIL